MRRRRSGLRTSCCAEPLSAERLHQLAAGLGADVPFFSPRDRSWEPATGASSRRSPCRATSWSCSCCRTASESRRPASVYAAFSGEDGFAERRAALYAALEAGELASLPPNDLASSPLADELLELGAFRADVSGAGPAVYGLFVDTEQAEAARETLANRGRDLARQACLVALSHARARRSRRASAEPAGALAARAEDLARHRDRGPRGRPHRRRRARRRRWRSSWPSPWSSATSCSPTG